MFLLIIGLASAAVDRTISGNSITLTITETLGDESVTYVMDYR